MISPYHRSLLLATLGSVSILGLTGCDRKEIKDNLGNTYIVRGDDGSRGTNVQDVIKISNEVAEVQKQNKQILEELKAQRTILEKIEIQREQPTQQSYRR